MEVRNAGSASILALILGLSSALVVAEVSGGDENSSVEAAAGPAAIKVVSKITAKDLPQAKGLGAIARAVTAVNAGAGNLMGGNTGISAIDGKPVGRSESHIVDAADIAGGTHEIEIRARVNGEIYRGGITYDFASGNAYELIISVAHLSANTREKQASLRAELVDTATGAVVASADF